MTRYKETYIAKLKEACNEMRLDYFPQVEASELLYRVITLEDIYQPLKLEKTAYAEPKKRDGVDMDELVRIIDEKISALDTDGQPAPLDEEDCQPPFKTGKRLLINADPGSGKTTFCKRLVLALLNGENAFFDTYAQKNQLHFPRVSLPVFVSCKTIVDLSKEALQTASFAQLLYTLCIQHAENALSQIPEQEFSALIEGCDKADMLLILDGWDEILDAEKERIFSEKVNAYLTENPSVHTLITIRKSYIAPLLAQPYTDKYRIAALTPDDVRDFCKKWCEVILAPSARKEQNYALIAEQIIHARDMQIRTMMTNPLTLSLLLTVSKNDGRLPENKSELFKQLVDLYIFWSTNKTPGALSAKSIRVLLAYVAVYFTKHERFHCTAQELEEILCGAFADLEWAFSDDVTALAPKTVAKELTRTGILIPIYDGKAFSFSESRYAKHRQMQEYLTAYAIAAGYADEEYNALTPTEIFESTYEKAQWREIVIFVALMNNGRLRQNIVRQLLAKAEATPDDNYVFTNLLFELVASGADIRAAEKHRIYDIIFSEHITDKQIDNIDVMLSYENKHTADFVTYINEKFAESIATGDSRYGFAKAVIDAIKEIQSNRSPLAYAERLLESTAQADVMTGIQMLMILAWCRYIHISNVFTRHIVQYTMATPVAKRIKRLLQEDLYGEEAAKCIKDCLLANFVKFDTLFDRQDVEKCIAYLSEHESFICECILSFAPIDNVYEKGKQPAFPQQKKQRYLEKLQKEINERDFDEAIFTFNLCAVIGCWTDVEQFYGVWQEMRSIYGQKAGTHIGKTRYYQIVLDQHLYALADGIYKVYTNDPAVLSTEMLNFLVEGLTDTQESKSMLAYLLRRREVLRVEKTADGVTTPVTIAQLLEKGVQAGDAFAVINEALCRSDTCRNVAGNMEEGLSYLQTCDARDTADWKVGAEKWLALAIDSAETEGLVVMYWLITLGLVSALHLSNEQVVKLIQRFKDAAVLFAEAGTNHIAVLERMVKRENTFTILDENGNEITCDVLFTFDSDETGKSYIIYTDNTHDQDGNLQVYASVYDPSGENPALQPIETEREWNIISIILEEIQNQIQGANGE